MRKCTEECIPPTTQTNTLTGHPHRAIHLLLRVPCPLSEAWGCCAACSPRRFHDRFSHARIIFLACNRTVSPSLTEPSGSGPGLPGTIPMLIDSECYQRVCADALGRPDVICIYSELPHHRGHGDFEASHFPTGLANYIRASIARCFDRVPWCTRRVHDWHAPTSQNSANR